MQAFPKPEFVHVNGINLEVFTAGDPNNPAIVMCHGWPEIAYSWRYLIPHLEKNYFLILPNQRGYGRSDRPEKVSHYSIEYLTDDIIALLDYYGHKEAFFIGHDMGAIVIWNLALMHPSRVTGLVNLSVAFMERGPTEWVGFWESVLGSDFYIVHFNRQPGVADAVFKQRNAFFLRNFYQKNQWLHPKPELQGMSLIAIAEHDSVPGDPIMEDSELQVFIDAFDHSGYTGGLNWYRNFSHNWRVIGSYKQEVKQPSMLIYGKYDMVPKPNNMERFVPNVEMHELPCGHWIQQEMPEEVAALLLPFVSKHYPS